MRAVIIDRDGVINHNRSDYVKEASEWQAIDGSLEAIARLSQAKFKVFIASNQAAIARGLFDHSDLHRIHRKMLHELEALGGGVDGFFFSPVIQGACRKPNPGMLLDIASRTGIKLTETPFIGDSLKDLQAAERAGAIPVLVRTGNGLETLTQAEMPSAVKVFDDLAAAVADILQE